MSDDVRRDFSSEGDESPLAEGRLRDWWIILGFTTLVVEIKKKSLLRIQLWAAVHYLKPSIVTMDATGCDVDASQLITEDQLKQISRDSRTFVSRNEVLRPIEDGIK